MIIPVKWKALKENTQSGRFHPRGTSLNINIDPKSINNAIAAIVSGQESLWSTIRMPFI
jgi:hypothetical protein